MVNTKQNFDPVTGSKNSSTLEPSLKCRIFADKIVQEELLLDQNNYQSKKEYWLELAGMIELEGFAHDTISTITKNVIEERLYLALKDKDIPKEDCKISGISHYYKTMQDAGYTNPVMCRNAKDKKSKITKSNWEEENEDFIIQYEDAISKLKAVVSVWRNTDSKLTIQEKKKLKSELYHMKKAGEFLDMAYDRKNLISPYMQHLLSIAYAESTQKHAGGLYLMYRIDLAQRKHGEAVKFFKKAGKFAKLLSGKQTTKAMKGKIRILNERYEPQNSKDAMDTGFSGQQCVSCHYWRVGYDNVMNHSWKKGDPVHEKYDTKLFCFHCSVIQTRKHTKLPIQCKVPTIDYSEVAR